MFNILLGHSIITEPWIRKEFEIVLKGHWVCGFAGYNRKTKECSGYPVGPFYYY